MDDCEQIKSRLNAALTPEYLEVSNFSDQHAGHAGSPNSGRSHFRLVIRSQTLNALPRVAAHQRIYAALETEMAEHIHALEIVLLK